QRYHQLKRMTEQDLFSTCTIADYSIGKSLVFGGVTLAQDEAALFNDLYTIMYGDLPRPELIVYVYLSMDRVQERIKARGRSYEQRIGIEYLEKLQERYLDHLQKLTGQRVLVIDLQEKDLLQDADAYEALRTLLQAEHPPEYGVVRL
ncbi:MAG: deoxynucleoside kinase, partial [Flavobacteriales bacterium]|nr:deoxynucleoside kinase [Flavobacteriales bacterium]